MPERKIELLGSRFKIHSVSGYNPMIIEQSGLVGLICTFISALLHRDVFGSGFLAHRLHPPCIQGVIFYESTNPFRPRPIERFGVI